MLFLVSGINITNKIADTIEKNPNIINGKGYQYNSPFKFYFINKSFDYKVIQKNIKLKKKITINWILGAIMAPIRANAWHKETAEFLK